jgi:hypothetical protein
MTPDAALAEPIKCHQAITGEQRLKIALDLHELSCEVAREGIRHQHPNADAEEVERLLRHRIALGRTP